MVWVKDCSVAISDKSHSPMHVLIITKLIWLECFRRHVRQLRRTYLVQTCPSSARATHTATRPGAFRRSRSQSTIHHSRMFGFNEVDRVRCFWRRAATERDLHSITAAFGAASVSRIVCTYTVVPSSFRGRQIKCPVLRKGTGWQEQ